MGILSRLLLNYIAFQYESPFFLAPDQNYDLWIGIVPLPLNELSLSLLHLLNQLLFEQLVKFYCELVLNNQTSPSFAQGFDEILHLIYKTLPLL